MKSIFLSKRIIWQIIFTFCVLIFLVGLFQLGQAFTSIETQNSEEAVPSLEKSKDEKIQEQGQEKEESSKDIPKEGKDDQQEEPGKTDSVQEAKKSQFFIEYRMQRDRARGQQIDLLRELVDNNNSSDDVRKEAQKRLLRISQLMEKEMEIENMIRAEDFKDTVVFLQESNATVIVQTKEISPEDEKKIKAIINRITEIKDGEITVIPKL